MDFNCFSDTLIKTFYSYWEGIFLKKEIFFLAVIFSVFSYSQHFVLVSAPGSGKGTFSQYMVEKYDYMQICPGDLFRNEILRQTDFGKQIQPIVEAGQYVEEAIVCNLMKQYIQESLAKGKEFILDGFPRSATALSFLKNLFEELGIVSDVTFIQFSVQDSICLERILGRMVCDTCHKVYHANFFSSQEHCCVDCGTDLSKRKADQEAIALERLVHFHTKVEPLLLQVEDDYKVIKINSEQPIETLRGLYDRLV